MKNKFLMIILFLIVVFSTIFVYTVYQDYVNGEDYKTDTDDASLEEVLSEIDESFLDEGDEVEIGEMI